MVTTFLRNPQNVILCVEPSGDAANLKTLGRCKQVDPNFERTVLIRTKLDKYYNDLSPLNVNEWFEGFGDLPKGMPKFAVSLPFWQDEAKSAQAAARSSQTASPNKNESTSSPSEDWGDGDSAAPSRKRMLNGDFSPPTRTTDFLDLRRKANATDLSVCVNLYLHPDLHQFAGFDNMAQSLEKLIEKRFSGELQEVLRLLQRREKTVSESLEQIRKELGMTSSAKDADINFLHTVRSTGSTYARALSDVMAGSLQSAYGRMSLADELLAFADHSRLME